MYQRIACVGVGTIGRSWALTFLLKGCEVNLHDQHLDILTNARDYVRSWLEFLIKKGAIEQQQLEVMNKLRLTPTLKDAVHNVDYIQESIPEDLELKKKILAKASRLSESYTVIASSTSGLSMTEMQKVALRPEMSC